jgi:hypothetical protein
MAIEVRGGKMAFVASIVAVNPRWVGVSRYANITHLLSILPADSEDEALGRFERVAQKTFPSKNGWTSHHIELRRIDNIAWVGPFDMDTVVEYSTPEGISC